MGAGTDPHHLDLVREYRVLYTFDVAKKLPLWHDGKARHFSLNHKVQVLDEAGAVVKNAFLRGGERLTSGCQTRVAGLLLDVEELLVEYEREGSNLSQAVRPSPALGPSPPQRLEKAPALSITPRPSQRPRPVGLSRRPQRHTPAIPTLGAESRAAPPQPLSLERRLSASGAGGLGAGARGAPPRRRIPPRSTNLFLRFPVKTALPRPPPPPGASSPDPTKAMWFAQAPPQRQRRVAAGAHPKRRVRPKPSDRCASGSSTLFRAPRGPTPSPGAGDVAGDMAGETTAPSKPLAVLLDSSPPAPLVSVCPLGETTNNTAAPPALSQTPLYETKPSRVTLPPRELARAPASELVLEPRHRVECVSDIEEDAQFDRQLERLRQSSLAASQSHEPMDEPTERRYTAYENPSRAGAVEAEPPLPSGSLETRALLSEGMVEPIPLSFSQEEVAAVPTQTPAGLGIMAFTFGSNPRLALPAAPTVFRAPGRLTHGLFQPPVTEPGEPVPLELLLNGIAAAFEQGSALSGTPAAPRAKTVLLATSRPEPLLPRPSPAPLPQPLARVHRGAPVHALVPGARHGSLSTPERARRRAPTSAILAPFKTHRILPQRSRLPPSSLAKPPGVSLNPQRGE